MRVIKGPASQIKPRYSLVTDQKTIDRLNKDSKTKAYRAMLLIDGKLYPPIATMEQDGNGKYRMKEHQAIGKWYKSDEHPELITGYKETKKNGRYGHIYIRKDNGTGVDVAYNPYFHSSFTPLNDQFKTAYKRPNLVVVEIELANSDINSGYRAEHSKNPTGLTEWTAGNVAKQLAKQGKPARKVYLSQYSKITRIVSDSEVASEVKKMLDGTSIAIPSNVVTPSLLKELKKIGVPIKNTVPTDDDRPDGTNGRKKSSKKSRLSLQSLDAKYMKAVKADDMETAQRMVDEAAKKAGYNVLGWHGTPKKNGDFTVFDKAKIGSISDAGDWGAGFYFAESKPQEWNGRKFDSGEIAAQLYADNSGMNRGRVIKAYLNTANMLTLKSETKTQRDELHNGDIYAEQILNIFDKAGIDYSDINFDGRLGDKNTAKLFDFIKKFGAKRFTDAMQKLGYNSIYSPKTSEYVVWEPEQIKSAEPVTRDDNDNIIPLSERFNPQNRDIRYSLRYLPKKSLELGFSSHIMSLHAGENFDKSEFGLHTSYGDYEYLYDYFGDGEFGVISKYPLNRIDEVIENGTRNKRDTDWYDDKWESYRRRIKSNSRFISSQGNSVSVNGLGNDPMEENQNDKSEENNQEGDISPEEDTYFKTGADGTNRPRYEIRFSINTSNLKQKWFAQMDAMRKKNEEALNERNRLRNRTLKEKIKDFAREFPDNYEYWMSNHRQRLQRWLKKNAAPLFGGSGIPDDLDPNMMLDTIDGRVQSKRDEFYDTNVQPIIDFLREKKINASDFNQFLFAMHAEERAKQIFKVNPEMQKFGVGATGWNYSETPDECKDRLFNKYGKAELMKAGQMFWDMNDKLVDKQVEYGLWSEDTAKSVRAAYKHYCPMKRLDDQSIYDGIVYYDPKNEDRKQTTANTTTNKRAMGRTSTPEHQFMFAVAAIDSVFRAGERNLAHQAMFKIAEKVMDPSIQLGQQKIVRFMDSDGEVAYRVAFEREPQTVVARFKGNPTTIHFDDPELYNAFTSPKGTAGLSMALARILRASTSAMASNATSRNFDFGAVNLFKDNQQAFTENAATKGKGFAWNVVRNLIPAMKTAYRYMTKGAVDADTSMYKEFLDNGGATGYLDVYKLDRYAETIEEEINSVAHSSMWDKIKYDGSRPLGTANRFIRHALAKFYKPFEFFNEILESATRFANYRAFRKNHSAARSAEHAKNITLNFNRHGALWTSEFNWVYMFSNAAIQAGIKSAKVFGELSKSRKGRLALASVILTGLIARLFNRGFSGRDPEDDELYYDKIPEYKKKSNLVIMKPNGKDYWSFPLQTTLALPYMVGDNLAAWLNGERTMLETTGDSLKGIMDALNPLGSDSRWWAWIVPTSVRPVTDVVSNTNFVGSPIHPEQSSFGPQMPKYQKHFRNTAKIYIDIAKALNEISGGNQYESGSIDLYPDDIRHLWTSYTGGFYRLVGKYVGNKAEDWVNPAKMPILSRFNGEVDDRKTRSDFNDYNDLSMKISKAKDEQQKWFLDKYPNNSVLTNAVKVANKRLQLLRTQFNKGLIDDETYQSHSVTAMKTAIGKIRKAGFK